MLIKNTYYKFLSAFVSDIDLKSLSLSSQFKGRFNYFGFIDASKSVLDHGPVNKQDKRIGRLFKLG
ncbi:hypothetical protein BpHYR1_008105 [Brachionus plicatilis]|uniref:Uncharacterized protein n=1 Tax=Brachionus plicatilis TaxID=10195 RepID=A0A3M7QYM9_BRAPC|nr:hypothetical protein BpHYR1_008105 [Brachionus plicatilis]